MPVNGGTPMGDWADQQMRGLGMATRALVHEPIGKPGGPGLWGMKGAQLPAYIQHMRNDLMTERGMTEEMATATAISQCRKWAMGGGGVTPETKAKAAAAIAELDALRAKAKATRSTAMTDYDADGLDASWDGEQNDLPDLAGLGVPEFEAAETALGWQAPAGEVTRAAKLGTGARFAALKSKLAARGATNPGALAAWIGRRKYGRARFTKLAAAARRRPAAARTEILRYYPLEDIHVVSRAEGDGSGRVVEAYAAVWNTPAVIKDAQGHYEEEIDARAFDQALRAAQPDRNNGHWRVAALYNHGMTLFGTPAERFSLPVGKALDIRPETRGLLTRTEYAPTPLGDEVLELISMGAILSQSFTGDIIRSDPMLYGPGDRYRSRGGILQRVKRLVLGLREYGPCPFAAYTGAEILGVRMSLPGDHWAPDSPEDEAPGPDGSGDGHSPEDESSLGEPTTGHRLYKLRTEELLRRAGITLPERR